MSRHHILLVEDDDDDQLLVSHVVRIVMNQDLTVAYDGQHALQLAQGTVYDLVVLDLQLPNMSGWDVAEALRQIEHYSDVPIIALTAFDQDAYRQQSEQAGITAYLTKPIDVDRFVEIISGHLNVDDN